MVVLIAVLMVVGFSSKFAIHGFQCNLVKSLQVQQKYDIIMMRNSNFWVSLFFRPILTNFFLDLIKFGSVTL
jgi:hypothetical protein